MFDLQIAYFGLEVPVPVPVLLEPLSVVVVLFLWCLWCFLVVLVVVVLWSPLVVCPDDAVLPLVPLWSDEPLDWAKLSEAVSASAKASVNNFFTLFFSSG